MTSSASLGLLFNLALCLVGPLGALLALALKPRWRKHLPAYGFGALTFLVSQVLLRIPMLGLLGQTPAFVLFTLAQPLLYSLILGFSAGLFENCGRWLTLRFLMKKHRRLSDGIWLGLGHGGVEALLLVGLGSLGLLLQGEALAGMGFAAVAMAGLERIFVILFHVGTSVMVLRAVNRHKPLWLALAVLLHTVLDTGSALLVQAGTPSWQIELYIAVFGLGMLAFTVYTGIKNKKEGAATQSSPTREANG